MSQTECQHQQGRKGERLTTSGRVKRAMNSRISSEGGHGDIALPMTMGSLVDEPPVALPARASWSMALLPPFPMAGRAWLGWPAIVCEGMGAAMTPAARSSSALGIQVCVGVRSSSSLWAKKQTGLRGGGGRISRASQGERFV